MTDEFKQLMIDLESKNETIGDLNHDLCILQSEYTKILKELNERNKECLEYKEKVSKSIERFKYIINLIKDCQTPSNVIAVRIHCACETILKELGELEHEKRNST